MSDLIRREDAIKALRCEYPTMPMFKNLREEWAIKTEGFRKAEEVIMSVPFADRPQGEWIAVSSYDAFGGSEELWNAHGNPTAFHYCSKCKAQSYVNEFGEELLTDYCPNCGAKMKGADDE